MLEKTWMMSDEPDDDSDASVLVQTRPKTKRPPLYKVLLLNDDFTPLGFVVAENGVELDLEKLKQDTNATLGKTQRLSALQQIDELPRSHIGKILKTQLRDSVT